MSAELLWFDAKVQRTVTLLTCALEQRDYSPMRGSELACILVDCTDGQAGNQYMHTAAAVPRDSWARRGLWTSGDQIIRFQVVTSHI